MKRKGCGMSKFKLKNWFNRRQNTYEILFFPTAGVLWYMAGRRSPVGCLYFSWLNLSLELWFGPRKTLQ